MVQVFDQASGNWDTVNNNILCYDYEMNTEERRNYETCTLYINATAAPNAKTFMKIQRDTGTTLLLDDIKAVKAVNKAKMKRIFMNEKMLKAAFLYEQKKGDNQ